MNLSHVRICLFHGEWCGFCYEGRRGRRAHKGHYGYVKSLERYRCSMARFLHRPSSDKASEDGRAIALEDRFEEEVAALGEFLCESSWEDGKKRQTGSLTVFFDEGVLKACVSDKDAGLVAFVSGASWNGLMQAIEKGLRQGSLEWRRARQGRRG